jgi:hypothetical protein
MESDSFQMFVAAVVTLMNETGHCDYAELFPSVGNGNLFINKGRLLRPINPGRYHTPNERTLKAVKSAKEFPPAMMAVAICELVPLNLITRGGPDSADGLRLEAKARKATSSWEDQLLDALKREGFSDSAALESVQQLRSGTEEERKRVCLVYHCESDSPQFKGSSSRGTPSHRVHFLGGARISRAMASYYRNHRLYRRCLAFLKEILPEQLPRAPFTGSLTYIPKLANRVDNKLWERRNAERRKKASFPNNS